MKSKANTQAELFGFKDPDLTTPEHDKICLWLYNNIEKLLEDHLQKIIKSKYKIVSIEFSEKCLEPLIQKSEYRGIYKYDRKVGFADMSIVIHYCLDNGNEEKTFRNDLFFEVKPSIKSFGELMRQLQLYRNALGPYSDLIVVCGSSQTEYFKILKDQNFGYLDYNYYSNYTTAENSKNTIFLEPCIFLNKYIFNV
jgi:hypothetical protein